MLALDAQWGLPRHVMVSGKPVRVPFSVSLDPDLCEFIPRWLASNGPEWTAGRLKALKAWAHHLLSGHKTFRSPWFAWTTYKGFMIPKLGLFEYLIDHRHDLPKVVQVMIVLNSYKLGSWGTPSLDSVMGVERSKPSDSYIPYLRRYVNLPRVPNSVLEPVEVVNTFKKYADDWGETHNGPYGLLDDDFPAEIQGLWRDMNENPYCLGRLTAVPDKGKMRTILIGHRAVQLRTKKLADWLRNWLWNQEEVASGQQDKFSKFIIRSMEKGRYMMSIDLSNATDRLSVEFQIKLLNSMGVPLEYFSFMKLPFYYQPSRFGKEGEGLVKGRYSNGQPMGLFVSFPMFELAHYVILKFATAVTDAEFVLCGDDVCIACKQEDSTKIFERYKNLIERFGGVISSSKTVFSDRFAEGVGAIFLKGIPKEIRIPSGNVSMLEALTAGTWIHQEIKKESAIGRSLLYSWLSTKEWKEYTEENRRALNEFLVLFDLQDWRRDALSTLAKKAREPIRWPAWESTPEGTSVMNAQFPKDEDIPHDAGWKEPSEWNRPSRYRWLTSKKFREALVSHKIISLYRKDHHGEIRQ